MSSATVIFLTSLLSIPITFTCNYFQNHLTPNIVCGIGVAVIIFMMLMVFLFRNKNGAVDPLYYVFSICCMSSVVDLLIGLENDGYISEFVHFYLEKGEPYLKTAHGTMICYWDGLAHYALYLTMLSALSWSHPFRLIGLFWCGSIINSLIVFLPGNFIGKHAVKTSVLLNIPFVLVPLYGLWRFLHFPRSEVQVSQSEVKASHQPLWRRPLDLLILLLTLLTIALALFRGCVALTFVKTDILISNYTRYVEPYILDPVVYPRLQLVCYMFHYVPYYIMCCYALMTPGQSWLLDATMFFAGGLAQGQFSYIGAALHLRTPYLYRVSSLANIAPFWVVNLLPIAHMTLLVLRVFSAPEYFMVDFGAGSERDVKSSILRSRSIVSSEKRTVINEDGVTSRRPLKSE